MIVCQYAGNLVGREGTGAYVYSSSPLTRLKQAAGFCQEKQDIAAVGGGALDLLVVHPVRRVQRLEAASQIDWVVDGCQTETALQLARHLLAFALAGLERCELLWLFAQLGGERERYGVVHNCSYPVVVFGQVEEQSGIASAALVFGRASCDDCDVAQELLFVFKADELQALLDRALDSLAVRANVTKQ